MVQAVMDAVFKPSGERERSEEPRPPRHRTDVTLFYDPPYEDELDDVMARHLVAYLVPAASLTYRAKVWTSASACGFDFLVDLGTRRVAIDYTDTPVDLETALVEDNDALALGTGNVDVILRVRRSDLEDRLYDTLHLLAKWEPNLFTPYGQRMFARRASEEARCAFPEPEADVAAIYYDGASGGVPAVTIEDVLSGELFEWPGDEDGKESVVMRRMCR
ncbi:MAG: hypothetical protein WD205_07205, partial [Rhodothermales bacterium]